MALAHLDLIELGSHAFAAHLHVNDGSCEACSITKS